MWAILSATIPIYLVLLVGYGCTKFGLFRRDDLAILGRFVIKLALPCLIFLAVSSRSIGEVLNPTYLLSDALGSILVFAVAFAYAALRGHRAVTGAFLAMGAGCVNTGFVGYPLFLMVVPDVAGLAVGMDMIIDNVVSLPLLLAIVEHFSTPGGSWVGRLRATALRLLRNPLFIAIGLALLVSTVGWQLPEVLTRSVTLLAQASTGLALFAVGGLLVGLPIRRLSVDLVAVVFGKLVLHPLAIALAVAVLVGLGLPSLPNALLVAVVLTGALPAMTIYPAIALGYGEEDLAAPVMAVSTVLSFVTLTGFLAGFHALGYL